jgi:hypothetical protein
MMLCTETVATWNNFEFGVDMKKEKELLGVWNSHIDSLTEQKEAQKTDKRKVKEDEKVKKAAEYANKKHKTN